MRKMSESGAISGNGQTSSEYPMAVPEHQNVWIKIEKLEPADEPTAETESTIEPETRVEDQAPLPESSCNPGPLKEVFHIVHIKPDKDLQQQSKEKSINGESASDDETAEPYTGAVFEPEVKLVVKRKEQNSKAKKCASKTCDECGRMFRRASSLALHMRSHEPQQDTEFQCDKCQRSFPWQVNLFRHQKACTGQGTHACSICRKQFKTKELLRSHMTVHTTERPYMCDKCDKLFKHPRYLRTHQASHNDVRPYRCEQCGKQFKHSSSAAQHRRRHTDKPKKLFTCSVCDKSFPVINALECHMRSHTNERPFQCAVCMRGFSHKHNMLRHMQRHDKVVQLKCEICFKEFPRESRLKYHMRVHYLNKKPYACGLCHKTYSHVQNITRHYKKKHPDHEYIAPITDAEFANKAWELHKNQANAEKEHSSYILPEFEQPNIIVKTEENISDNPLPQPEMVILENNCVKLEVEEEILC